MNYEDELRAHWAQEREERRDRFAAAALMGLLVSVKTGTDLGDAAIDAVTVADALLAELDKTP